jgi:hypothetical protein
MKIERFEDLEVWQLSRELVKSICKLTSEARFPKDFGLAIGLHTPKSPPSTRLRTGLKRGLGNSGYDLD